MDYFVRIGKFSVHFLNVSLEFVEDRTTVMRMYGICDLMKYFLHMWLAEMLVWLNAEGRNF